MLSSKSWDQLVSVGGLPLLRNWLGISQQVESNCIMYHLLSLLFFLILFSFLLNCPYPNTKVLALRFNSFPHSTSIGSGTAMKCLDACWAKPQLLILINSHFLLFNWDRGIGKVITK